MKKRILVLCAVLLLATALFVSCGGNGKKDLTAPQNVRYDGTTLTWDEVENADYYQVQINDGDAKDVNTNKLKYAAADAEFTVKVSAVIDDDKKPIVSDATEVSFQPLGKVSEIRIENDGSLSWDAVEGATGYLIKIDGTELGAPVDFPAFAEVPVGKHSVQVRAIVQGDNSYYSSWSSQKSLTMLGTLTLDDITYANGYIKWNSVSGAQNYSVLVNGVPLSESVVGNSIAYDPNNINFDVTVQAIGNHASTYDGKVSEVKKFVFLDTVTNIWVSDGELLWDPVNGASGYQLKIDGRVLPDVYTECKYTKLSAGIQTRVEVMPVSNDSTYFSAWSVEKSVYLLKVPVVRWDSSANLDGEAETGCVWDSIPSAVGYAVRLTKPDGSQVVSTYGDTQRAFQEAFLDTGVYYVEVKALAENGNGNTCDSQYSKAIKVVRLEAPKAADSNFITSNPRNLADGFVVTFQKVAGAAQYKIYKDENLLNTISSSANQFAVKEFASVNSIEQQTHNFKIQAIGSVTSVNGQTVATLSSLSSKSLAFDITVLAAPINPTISGFTYSYSSVDQAYGYTVDVQGSVYDSGETSYDLGTLNAGIYNVRVCAKGNGSTVLPSAYSVPISVHRLEAPTNVRIDTSDASEGVLAFDTVPHATGYVIVFNNDGNALPINTIGNMNQYITEQGTTVYMKSSANCFNADKTVYYMESQPGTTTTFKKLAKPQFGNVAFVGSNLVWNAPNNIDSNTFTPTYIVYNGSGEISYDGEKNGTSMDLSFLAGGRSYEFRVKAIGNGTQYINSEVSSVVSIYKLETPVVDRQNGQYTWGSVISAIRYVVYVDGKEVASFQGGEANYAYTPSTFKELKSYDVEIYAIGDNGLTLLDSDPCKIRQETKQLETPDFTISYSEKYFSESGKILVNISKLSPYAKGYTYYIGGTKHEITTGETTYFEYNPNGVGKVAIGVYAMGGNFDENGVYYLDSQMQGNNPSYTINILAHPSDVRLNMSGQLTWTAIAGAIGYELEVSFDGGAAITQSINGNSFDLRQLEGYANAREIVVKVRALGNGTSSVSSQQYTKTFNPGV